MSFITSSRKMFLEYLIGGGKKKLVNLNLGLLEPQDLFFSSAPDDSVLLRWDTESEDEVSYPALAVVKNSWSREILTLAASSPNSPFPLTSFCRIVSKDDFDTYRRMETRKEKNQKLINAVIGLSLAEALLYSEKKLKTKELTPAICKRTLSFTFAKAFKVAPVDIIFDRLVDGWLEAYNLTGSQEVNTSVKNTVPLSSAVLKTVTSLYYEQKPNSDLSVFCQNLLKGTKSGIDRGWKNLVSELPNPLSISSIQAKNREERGVYYQEVQDYLYANNRDHDDRGPAICAFLATQIAPESLEHMDLILKHEDSRIVLWYGFFAALQGQGSVMRGWESMPIRLLRDINNHESFDAAPRADISLSELELVSKFPNDLLSKKLGQPNEIQVEIVPLVTAPFRYSSRQNKQYDTNAILNQERETLLYELQKHKDASEYASRRIFDLAAEFEDIASVLTESRARGNKPRGTFGGPKKY